MCDQVRVLSCSATAACVREEAAIDEEVAAEKHLHEAAANETSAEMAWRSARQRLHAFKLQGARPPPQFMAPFRGQGPPTGPEVGRHAAVTADSITGGRQRHDMLHAAAKAIQDRDDDGEKSKPVVNAHLEQAAPKTQAPPAAAPANAAEGNASKEESPFVNRQQHTATDDVAARHHSPEEKPENALKRRGRAVDPNSARQKRLRAVAIALETAKAAEAAERGSDSRESSGEASPSASATERGSPKARTRGKTSAALKASDPRAKLRHRSGSVATVSSGGATLPSGSQRLAGTTDRAPMFHLGHPFPSLPCDDWLTNRTRL